MFRYALLLSRNTSLVPTGVAFGICLVWGLIEGKGARISFEVAGDDAAVTALICALVLMVIMIAVGTLWVFTPSKPLIRVMQVAVLAFIYFYAFIEGGYAGLAAPIVFLPQMVHQLWLALLLLVVGMPALYCFANAIASIFYRPGDVKLKEEPLHPLGARD